MLNLAAILSDKSIKPKEKTEQISALLIENKVDMRDLIHFASSAKPVDRATCIEALEFATRIATYRIDRPTFAFATGCLREKAPRVKWEAAKLIGNTARFFQDDLEEAVGSLLENTNHEGTVVRWSAAFALGEILKLKSKLNGELMPAIESILEKEEKNSIKKIYLSAIKKVGKG
jgi:hypothetical protein